MSTLDYPYHFDSTGRTALADEHDHIRDLIEQVLFTTPGERVMRPDFGAGLLALVFEPNGTTMAATAQFIVQSALQQHLGHLISVNAVTVDAVNERVEVLVQFSVHNDANLRKAKFTIPPETGAGS